VDTNKIPMYSLVTLTTKYGFEPSGVWVGEKEGRYVLRPIATVPIRAEIAGALTVPLQLRGRQNWDGPELRLPTSDVIDVHVVEMPNHRWNLPEQVGVA
jgi:hypothetical protein